MAPLINDCKLERHEILHYLRCSLETDHHIELYCNQIRMACTWDIDDLNDDLGSPDHYKAQAFWNKSVPIYIFPVDMSKRFWPSLLAIVLHNYLYRRWFKPYETNIEYGQFIAMVMAVVGGPRTVDPGQVVNATVTLNQRLCQQLDRIRHADETTALDISNGLYEAIPGPFPTPTYCGYHSSNREAFRQLQFYHLRPLFRAVAIAILGRYYDSCHHVANISEMPVLTILTGNEEGLSAPITFGSIKDNAIVHCFEGGRQSARTTLATAVTFVMAMEEREIAAFGELPDPEASTVDPEEEKETFWSDEEYIAERLGRIASSPRLLGPSSKWVDKSKYKEWTGMSARYDLIEMNRLEHQAYRMVSGCSCHDHDRSPMLLGGRVAPGSNKVLY